MGKIKALVADDSKVMRLMVMKAIRQAKLADFAFDEAEDGVQALEKIREGDYGIVFLDWNMPNKNGIEVVQCIRSDGKDPEVPIVMVTSETGAAKVQQAIDEAGATAYIHKPFTPEQMEQTLGPIIDAIRG